MYLKKVYYHTLHKARVVYLALKSLKLHEEIICRIRSFPPPPHTTPHSQLANIRSASKGRHFTPPALPLVSV